MIQFWNWITACIVYGLHQMHDFQRTTVESIQHYPKLWLFIRGSTQNIEQLKFSIQSLHKVCRLERQNWNVKRNVCDCNLYTRWHHRRQLSNQMDLTSFRPYFQRYWICLSHLFFNRDLVKMYCIEAAYVRLVCAKGFLCMFLTSFSQCSRTSKSHQQFIVLKISWEFLARTRPRKTPKHCSKCRFRQLRC